MNSTVTLSLFNPAISLVLALAFALLWALQPRQRHHAWLAGGYALTGVGFLLQGFTLPIGLEPTRLLSVSLFLVAGVLIGGAVIGRFTHRPRFAFLSGIAGTGFAAFTWFMFVEPDLTTRVFVINLALGTIAVVAAVEVTRAVRRKQAGHGGRLLAGVAVVLALNFVLRPVLLLLIEGPYLSYATFATSLYWTTSMLVHGVLSLLMALALLASAALDAVGAAHSDSMNDSLSGLHNRRGFDTCANALLESCAAAGLPAALVVADLDAFKSINDRYGHAAGDRVIAEFAALLGMAAGRRGCAARTGGEEFALLLPLSDLAAARVLADAVRSAFAAAPIPGLPSDLRVTASFGVVVRSDGESLAELMARADEALYRAKRGGRDSVRLSWVRPREGLPAATGTAA